MKNVQMHYSPDWSPEKADAIKVNRGFFIKSGLEGVSTVLDSYNSKFDLGGFALTLLRGLGVANRFGTNQESFNCLYYYGQLSYAWFRVTTNDQKLVTFQISNKYIETTGKFKNSHIGSGFVMKGIEAAFILRNREALAFYADIPVTFTEQANQQDLIWETMMHFYQTIIKGKGTVDEVAAAYHHISSLLDWEEYKKYITIEGFNSSSVWKMVFDARVPIVKAIFLPLLTIYHSIFHQDQSGFEEAVYEALLKWQAYYTVPKFSYEDGQEVDRAYESDGYLALPIAAACAFAYDRGMKLTNIQSDYIPDWMIEGQFEGFELLVKGD